MRSRPRTEGTAAPEGMRTGTGTDGLAALTWAVGSILAFVVVRLLDIDPLSARGAALAPAVGVVWALACAGACVLTPALRSHGRWAGVVAGGFAAWVCLAVLQGLHGTPYGFGGVTGDAGRLAVYAAHFTTTWFPSDALDPSVPAEYPPLMPWIVGHAAALIGHPPWSLLGEAEAATVSASIVLAFVLWRRLVGPRCALLLSALPLLFLSQVDKSFEIVVLASIVPWMLRTIERGAPRPARLSWLYAGALGGLMFMTYPGFLLSAGPGFLALIGLNARAGPVVAYLRHVGLVAVVSLAVSSPYSVPLLWATLTGHHHRVNDLYLSTSMASDPLGVDLSVVDLRTLLLVLGLVVMVGAWGRVWWGRPLAVLFIGVYVYRILNVLNFIRDGHTGFFHYTERISGLIAGTAAILGTAEVVRRVPEWSYGRVAITSYLRRVVALGCALLLAAVGQQMWLTATPSPLAVKDFPPQPTGLKLKASGALLAHAELLPDGSPPRYAAPDAYLRPPVAARQVRRAVERTRGRGARPRTVSDDDRLYVFLDWPSLLPTDRTGSNNFLDWDDRFVALQHVAAQDTPQSFTAAADSTPFGPVQAFVLRATAAGWSAIGVNIKREQIDPADWKVTMADAGRIVVVVRRP